MNTKNLLSLLQFSDGLFPTGAYAHSMGLEWYVENGTLKTAGDTLELVTTYLECSLGPLDSVMMLASYKATEAHDPEALLEVDRRLEVMKTPAEQRNASHQMGHQTLRVLATVRPTALVSIYQGLVIQGVAPGHHATVFGLAAATMGWGRFEAAQAFLYTSCVTMVSAAIKLIPLGQIEGQKILWALHPTILRLADEATNKSIDDAWSFTPALEIASMRHAQLDGRLFRS